MSCKRWSCLAAFAFVLLVSSRSGFAQSLSEVQENIRARGHRWTAGETSVSALPDYEKKRRLGLLKSSAQTPESAPVLAATPSTAASPSVDWSAYVTPVRDQGSCGDCWAFATTAALESNVLIRQNTPGNVNEELAEQILLSCSGAGNCEQGGSISKASNFLVSTGLPPEADFPYTATDNSCSNAKPGWSADTSKIGSWAYVTTASADLSSIKSALVAHGPLVTTMEVYSDFFYYTGGVYEYATGSQQGGHAVLIVGYTDDATRSDGGYFKAKNSWGTGWGAAGFFYIGYSQLTSPVSFGEFTLAYTAPAAQPLPPAPTSLTAQSVSGSQINVAWIESPASASGFSLERCTGSGCSGFTPVATLGAAATAYADTGLSPGTAYRYRVRAYDSSGYSGYSNTATASTAAACGCALSAQSKSFSSLGGSATVQVFTSSPSCPWTAVSKASWISITSSSSSSFMYRVSRNPGGNRSGVIVVGTQSYTVNQAGH